MLMLFAQLIEFIFSVALCTYMKVGREETKMSGRVLKFAYRVEKNLLYNYEFGRYTKDLRFWLIPFLIPTLYRKIMNMKSSFGFYQIVLTIVDILSLIDYINTTESYQRYCLVYSIRVLRTMIMLFELVQQITNIVLFHIYSSIKAKQQQQQQQIQQLQQQTIQQQQESDQSDSEEQQKELKTKKQQQIKRLISPQMKIPCICLNLSINSQQHQIQIISPWSFEESFHDVQIREQLLILIKMNYSCQIYQGLKKVKCNSQALHKYRELIADYLSQLIWMN